MKPCKGSIHNWKRRFVPGGFVIVGEPHGHPDFQNWIITSLVQKMEPTDPYTNGRDGYFTYEVTTLNSFYELVGEELPEEIPCPVNNYIEHGLTPPKR